MIKFVAMFKVTHWFKRQEAAFHKAFKLGKGVTARKLKELFKWSASQHKEVKA